MAKTTTVSLRDEVHGTSGQAGRGLVFALDCNRLHQRPWRVSLAGVEEVVVGRGPERAAQRRGGSLIVTLPDASVSSVHARLRPVDGEWVIEDAQSKNGTLINGRPASRAPIGERDVVEIGTTFCLLRRGDGDLDPGSLDERPLGLRTLCEPLARAVAMLERVAASPLPVLLLGETGTGKEMAARAIHQLSKRAGAFTAINCGGLPESLVASELFGARKGAFSGADADRAGLVQAAHRGTLFLDEIAELPEASQAVLLRVLQERELVPLGATRPIPVDIRVVAATHVELGKLVAARRFRKDLFARLRGYTLTLPPLRERLEDLGLLVAELMARLAGPRAARYVLSRPAARALFAYDWPFNVRELEHVLGAAVAVSGSEEISLAHLPDELRASVGDGEPLPGLRERERFSSLAHEHAGNVSAIARALGTSRSHVRRLAERFGVDLEAARD